jgi:hypothetical protein
MSVKTLIAMFATAKTQLEKTERVGAWRIHD